MNDLEFEQQVRASLRHGAEQVLLPEMGVDPLTVDHAFEDEIRDGLRAGVARLRRRQPPDVHRRERRRPRFVFEGLAAAAVAGVIALALMLAVAARHRDHVSGAQPGLSAPQSWQITVGFVQSPSLVPTPGTAEFSAPASTRCRLTVSVVPLHPDGKTYLYRSFDRGVWVLQGPHNTDATGSEMLWVVAPPAGHTAAYRLYVPSANGYAEAYSRPLYVHGT